MAREWLAQADAPPNEGADVLADRVRNHLVLGDVAGAEGALARLAAVPGLDPRVVRSLQRQVDAVRARLPIGP